MLRRTAIVATLAAAALALSSCAGTPSKPAPSGSANDPNASLVVGLVLEPTTLDIRRSSGAALEQLLIDNIYQGLVSRTPQNEIVDKLATAHEVSSDGLTYSFTLAPDITFHDGSVLDSEDVVSSFQEAQKDESVNGHGMFANVTAITAPDATSVEITLSEPDQNFLFNLTGAGGLVFATGDTTDPKTAENGSGPFTLDTWKKGDSISLARFDDYWGKPAGLAEVVLQYIPDFTAGVNAAVQHDVDVLTAIDPNLVPQLEKTDFTITEGKTTDKATLAFNNAKAPLNDKKVRQALRMAIDHKAVLAATGGNQALYGPIPELDPGFEDLSSSTSYNPAEAKKLLAEAGQTNLKLTLTIPSFYGTTISQVLVSQFNAIGVTLTVKNVEFSTWLNDVYTNKDYDLSYVLHVEPRDFGNWANPDYYFGYNNADVQKLYADAMAEVDPDASAKLLAQAAKIVADDAAADWLYVGTTLTAIAPGVSGFPTDSVNSRIDLAAITLTK